MLMAPEKGLRLTEELAGEIKNQGEKAFALACLEVGCEVYYQIPVGDSNIDFRVINPKANNRGKLVEITMEKRKDVEKKFVQKTKNGKKEGW